MGPGLRREDKNGVNCWVTTSRAHPPRRSRCATAMAGWGGGRIPGSNRPRIARRKRPAGHVPAVRDSHPCRRSHAAPPNPRPSQRPSSVPGIATNRPMPARAPRTRRPARDPQQFGRRRQSLHGAHPLWFTRRTCGVSTRFFMISHLPFAEYHCRHQAGGANLPSPSSSSGIPGRADPRTAIVDDIARRPVAVEIFLLDAKSEFRFGHRHR